MQSKIEVERGSREEGWMGEDIDKWGSDTRDGHASDQPRPWPRSEADQLARVASRQDRVVSLRKPPNIT